MTECIPFNERMAQLEAVIAIRTKITETIEGEGGYEAFKLNTAELRGELRALKNVRMSPDELEDSSLGTTLFEQSPNNPCEESFLEKSNG